MGHGEDFASARTEVQPGDALSQQGPAPTLGFMVSLWLQVGREQTEGRQGRQDREDRGRVTLGAVGGEVVSSGNFLCGLILFSSLLSVLGTLRFMWGPVVLLSPPTHARIHGCAAR